MNNIYYQTYNLYVNFTHQWCSIINYTKNNIWTISVCIDEEKSTWYQSPVAKCSSKHLIKKANLIALQFTGLRARAIASALIIYECANRTQLRTPIICQTSAHSLFARCVAHEYLWWTAWQQWHCKWSGGGKAESHTAGCCALEGGMLLTLVAKYIYGHCRLAFPINWFLRLRLSSAQKIYCAHSALAATQLRSGSSDTSFDTCYCCFTISRGL